MFIRVSYLEKMKSKLWLETLKFSKVKKIKMSYHL